MRQRNVLLLVVLAIHWPEVRAGWNYSRVLQSRSELREMKAHIDWMLAQPWWCCRRPPWRKSSL